jgi:hypothetical protein
LEGKGGGWESCRSHSGEERSPVWAIEKRWRRGGREGGKEGGREGGREDDNVLTEDLAWQVGYGNEEDQG